MPDIVAEQPRTEAGVETGLSWPLVAAGVGAGAIIAGTLVLWMHYGTAVFFEIIAAGLAACF